MDGALIGCGFFAQNHLHAWQDLAPRARLVAVCDTDPAKAKRAAAAFSIQHWYTDAKKMFETERLDFVDIATTMPSHRPLVELAAAHRVPIIVQKPLAPSWDDCVAIVQAAERAGVPLMVHENFRFQTPMLRVADILASGVIGAPTWARISFRTGYDVFANQPYLLEERELIVMDLGIHLLDLARVFLGEVEHLSCELQQQHSQVRAEDTATMLLRHTSGAVSVVDCTYMSRDLPDPFPQTLLHIEGPKGAIRMGRDFALDVISEGRIVSEYAGSPLLPWTAEPWHIAQESVRNTSAHFVDSLERGVTPATSGRDNLRTYALVRAAYAAAASGFAEKPSQA